jgi:hypothetical protein
MDRRAIARIEKLPELARAKLRQLELARMGSEDSGRAAFARLSGLAGDTDPQLRAALANERDRHSKKAAELSRLSNALMQWLSELRPDVALELADPVSVELNGKQPAEAIAAVRAEIEALRGKLNVIRKAPLPRDAQIDLIENFVARMMQRAAPKVSIVNDQINVRFRGDVATAEDVFALLCLASPDAACRSLERALGPERTDAMSKNDRLRAESEIDAALVRAERFEESAIEVAAASGVEIMRRPDANPLCVLGVVIAKPPQAQVA